MDPRRTVSPESALASDIFDKFCGASTLKSILAHYRQLCSVLRIKPTHFPDFYPRLRSKLSSWRAQGLWAKFEKRASHKCYGRGKACYGTRVLIIGSGPCGLRAAIEAQLLGAKVVLVEKRDRFSRNNVLHLWPFVITDLKGLGAKKFYGKFCAGSIDHISIRQLQCILLKVAVLLGVEVHEGVSFEGLRQPTENEGWRAVTSPSDHPVSHYTFDVLIGADGRRNTLDGFRRKALRAKLAIAITANFINKHTEAEARVKEISGVSYIFNQKFFQDLNEATGIDLENIVYYKDETHYFVMTAKKQSLLQKGVLLHDYADTAKLLSHENISTESLKIYALEAAIFSTENQLPNLEFAVNHYGQPDVAMFDFTAMYQAENACRVVQRKNHKLLMTLVGDSLLEPFWPTGSGCARGFLSSFDACWMIRSWSGGARSPMEVMAERESIYRLLAQTTPENLNKEHTSYTIDPHSRYPNLNLRAVMPFQVKSLYDTDETIPDVTDSVEGQQLLEAEKLAKKRRRDSVIAVDALLSWMRDQVSCYGLEMSDVRDAFVRGDVLCAIIHRFRPDLIEFPLPSEENVEPLHTAAYRNQLAFDLLHEEYGLTHVMSGWESVQSCSPDFLSCVAYLSQVYEIFRGEIPQIKYPRVESCEDLEEAVHRSSQHQFKYTFKPAISSKHHHHSSGKPTGRRSRMSSSGRESREGDTETSARRHKKRRSEDRSSRSSVSGSSGAVAAASSNSGREIRTTLGGHGSRRGGDGDSEKNVPGLARDLEAKLKGRPIETEKQKPKDLIRAIGKIEKTDWNVQLIEKKIAESKGPSQAKADRDDKVPRWSREAFDDKREALKRKMEGVTAVADGEGNEKFQLFEETMKKLGSKLKEGNALEIGQRGSNKVSAMAEQLVHKLEKPEQSVPKQPAVARPVFEFPKKGGSECCHFCKERVYVVERMTAEGKFFHRNCFRCEYCNTALRVGNYVFDREGRYGDRFFCTAHYNTIWLYGWKKYDQELTGEPGAGGKAAAERVVGHMVTPTSQQILSEMDERGTTPERVEFENSVECASEDDLLSEMDEDEWTDRNFGASNADNNTPDEASDLSDDEDITPEGNKVEAVNHQFVEESLPEIPVQPEENPLKKEVVDSSDSDTEVASGEDSDGSFENEDEDEDEEEEEEEEEDEDEGGGSTTEIETDSEFAEDPPHSVPGTIPTIVVDEPEQIVTRMIDSAPISHTQTPNKRDGRGHHHPSRDHHHHHNHNNHQPLPPIYHIEDLNDRMVEPVKKGLPERSLPRVTAVPKKWEPLSINPEGFSSKMSLELKKKYLQGNVPVIGIGAKKPGQDAAAQNQFRSVLDMISEQQKLLQPAPKPSATMQAFLDGAEKLKNKTISPLSASPRALDQLTYDKAADPLGTLLPKWTSAENEVHVATTNGVINRDINSASQEAADNTLNMNRLNLEKTIEACQQAEAVKKDLKQNKLSDEKQDVGKEKELKVLDDATTPGQSEQPNAEMPSSLLLVNGSAKNNDSPMVLSDGMSQSETDTQSTIIVTNKCIVDPAKTPVAEKPFEVGDVVQKPRTAVEEDDDSDTETGSGEPLSDLDDLDIEDVNPIKIEPPRVEIEDEFGGVTLAVDVDNEIDDSVRISSSDSRDSLNSGVFLETELSDWVKDGNDCSEIEPRERSTKKKSGHGKGRHGSRRRDPSAGEHGSESTGIRETSHLALELEDMDFMDVDGLSSPEDQQQFIKRKEGYAKLETEEEGPESILPDFSVVLRTSDPHDDQPSPRTLERQQRPTYSSDEQDESGHSSTPTVESCSTGPQLEKSVSLAESVSKQDKSSPPLQQKPQIIEAINPVIAANRKQIEKAHEIQLLDRVVPFSNARDSLDYRKMKGITSPIKSKDLYSTYCLPSVKGELLEDEDSLEPNGTSLESQQQQSSSTQANAMFGIGENHQQHRSPEMARKIEEIHKERAKQNDLIRSMVMGRIRKSPEKNSRRGSRGSLSPLGASSSSGASASGSSEHVLRCEDELVDSRRSSQNSILSHSNHSHDGGEETDESQRNSSSANEVEFPSRDSSSAAEPILKADHAPSPSDLSAKSASSSQFSSENSIPHHKLQKSSSTSSQSPPGAVVSAPVRSPSHQQLTSHAQQQHQPYEPVFTSSPRFRNRPKFENPLSVYQSVTNPPTPVNPSALSGFAATPALTPGSEASSSGKEQPRGEREPSTNKSIKVMKSHSPSFYRSMPDLSAFLVSSSSIPPTDQTGSDGSSNESRGFATPDMKQWNAYKQMRGIAASTSVDREKARKAARERARLKSDEELGLSPTDYANLKEKVRRKASMTDDDVFKSGSVPTTPVRETLRGGYRKGRPMSDVFDAAFSLRPNVDFPITKTNPFLVSSPLHDPRDMGLGDDDGWFNHHEEQQPECQDLSEVEDPGFAHLKLRVSSPGKQKGVSERKISPEKAKSMGWHSDGQVMGMQDSGMPNYFSPTPTLSTSPPAIANTANLSRTPLSLTPRADGNWFFEKPESTLTFASRPRSNTLSDLNLSPGSLLSGSNNNSNSQSQGIPTNSPNVSPSQGVQSRLSSTEVPSNGSTACTGDVNVAINSYNNGTSGGGQQTHDGQCTTPVSVSKAKALSTDTLLDDSDSPTGLPERTKGVSVPDIAHSVSNEPRVSPERKNRKSKDRDRRRSLIQAVSDFFTIRGSSMSQSGSNNGSPTDKSGHSQSTSSGNGGGNGDGDKGMSGSSNNGTPNGGSGREKFSIFKLTPKILQSKERRNSKSREIISPPPPAPSGGPSPVLESTIPPPKPARAAFSSYLAQPDMVIQRLTSSPTTYKSSRSNQGRLGMDGNLGGDITLSPTGSSAGLSGLGNTVDHMATLSIVATPSRPGVSHCSRSRSDLRHHRNDHRSRMREMQEIQLQLETIEAQQRSLESRGVAVEKRIRGEEPDEKNREESELMEEWFTLVREKTRMARFEKELLVRAEELELETRKERLEEQLDNSLLLNDAIKSPEDKNREIELLHELRAVEEQRGKLLTSFQEDMRQYENEDADLEAKIASSRLSPKESNV
ncbi:unnamed protein product [Orchesella dallaii]|uniref:F-actin monooxygenase n=1 Tax=Orchesella dallaii TaxID=48710 RepID=A0ABP1PMW7_9HEXA